MKKIILILFIAIISCSSNSDVEKSLAEVGINLFDKYSILENNSEASFGESSKNFDLIISEKDFALIKTKIEHAKDYREYEENEFPNSVREFNNDDIIIAFKSGSKYFYKVAKAKTNEKFEIVLTGKNKLSFIYFED
ncbi:hypothetical protein G4D82_14150 [Flavobacterium sp. CYK-4]|uniref:hypothetical protein n=1 Tax=Flavobacterium lotistagni TaxID=2709660 RepID=UPI00140A2237|nr:hypothetical protein [Flavobacterium lotistagni]NHM08367.1 hypothetical protein [Flavobacterium lotistagni]